MIEVVAEQGYDRATVREIARVGGVSTRAFYEHYSGKEQCFLRVHRRVAHRLLRRVEAFADGPSGDARLRDAVSGIIEEWGRDETAARFLLAGPYGAGSAAMRQLRLLDRSLGSRLNSCLNHLAEEGESTRLIADGIVIGLTATTRSRMLNEEDVAWSELRQGLTEWALSLSCQLSEPDALHAAQGRAECDRLPSQGSSSHMEDRASSTPGDDLTLLHSAIAKLAAGDDADLLTARHICAAAGVSRRSFDKNFTDVDECLVVAATQRLDYAIAHAQRVGERESTPVSRASRSFTELCTQLSCDPALARLCFGDSLKSGERLAQRDRLLVERIAAVLTDEDVASPSRERLAVEATLGAVLGLLGREIAAGRAAGLRQKASDLACLIQPHATSPHTAMSAVGARR